MGYHNIASLLRNMGAWKAAFNANQALPSEESDFTTGAPANMDGIGNGSNGSPVCSTLS